MLPAISPSTNGPEGRSEASRRMPAAIVQPTARGRLLPCGSPSVDVDSADADSGGVDGVERTFRMSGTSPVSDIPVGVSVGLGLGPIDSVGGSQVVHAAAPVSTVERSGRGAQCSQSSLPRPVAFDASVLQMNLRVARFTTSATHCVPADILVARLNTYYEFKQLSLQSVDLVSRIADPTYLVFRCPVSAIVNAYRFFSHIHMNAIATHHNILATRHGTLEDKRHQIMSHMCTIGCGNSIFVFKTLSLARTRYVIEPRFTAATSAHRSFDEIQLLQVTESSRDLQEQDVSDLSYLDPPTDSLRAQIIKEWQEQTSTDALRLKTCAACAKRTRAAEIKDVKCTAFDLKLLRNDALPTECLPTSYNFLAYDRAILCSAGLSDVTRPDALSICGPCAESLKLGEMPKFALANWLYYGHEALPANVRTAFDESSLFERMLVCRVRYNSVSCRFKAADYDPNEEEDAQTFVLRNFRKGVRGNVMVTPLNAACLNDVLPPSPETIRDTMSVVFIGSVPPTRQTIAKLSPVLVRKSRVKTMIEFLVRHNRQYGTLKGFRGYSAENLNKLFDARDDDKDEAVPRAVHIGHIAPNEAVDSATADYTRRNVDGGQRRMDQEVLMENVGFTLGDDSPTSYRDMKLLALERCLAGKPFLASRRGTTVVPDFDNPFLMSMAFPEEDPWGIGGMLHPSRRRKITAAEQVSHLLTVHGGRFQRHPQFAFFYYNVLRKQLVSMNMRYKAPQNHYRHIIDEMLAINLEQLSVLRDKCKRNPLYIPVNDVEKKIMTLMNSIGLVARHVPGSTGHKVKLRNEIRGLIIAAGAPSLFVTLNPADVDNPIVRLFSGEDINLEDMARGEDMDGWKRRILAARNPAACALFFDLMITKFISVILRYGASGPGLFGKCTGYYVVVEAQGKGTLHGHMLIWLNGHLHPQAVRNMLAESDLFKSKLTAWLESTIRSEMMDDLLNTSSESTRRYGLLADQPNPGTVPAPLLCHAASITTFRRDYVGFVDALLRQYNWHVHQTTCWKYLRRGQHKTNENCRLGMTGITHQHTTIDPETFGITLRKRHPWIANYNDLVIFLLKCNMDIKFVGSGQAAQAFLYYITDYITKSPLQVHVGLAALVHAISVANDKHPELSSSEAVDKVYVSAMTSTVNSMMGHQEMSHPQVMSYLIGGGDHYTSHNFVVLYWGAIKRYVDRYFKTILLEEEDETPEDGLDLELNLSLGAGTISASNQILDYVFRCQSPGFESVCLYDFISRVSKRKRTHKEIQRLPLESTWAGQFSAPSHPQFNTHVQTVRRKAVIPVIMGPKFHHPGKTPEEKELWAKDVVTLFRPWRTPLDLKTRDETWTAAAASLYECLDARQKRIVRNMNVLTECRDARQEHSRKRRGRDTTNAAASAELDGLMEDNTVILTEDNPYAVFWGNDLEQGEEEDVAHPETANPDEAVKTLIGNETLAAFRLCLAKRDGGPERGEVGTVELESGEDAEFLKACSLTMTVLKKRRRPERAEEDERQRKRMRLTRPDAFVDEIVPGSDVFRRYFASASHRQIIENVLVEKSIYGNAEQLRAIQIITKHLLDGGKQLLMYIAGVGGTGKSHLIKTVVEIFSQLGIRDALHIGAPTGIAATLIGGFTLHALTMASPQGKSKDMDALAMLWRGVRYVIIDEISMVGALMLSNLSSRLKQAMGDDSVRRMLPFGGVNVIFCGDFGQLKPPCQHSLFAYELVKSPAFEQARNADGISAMNGAFLWRQVDVVVQLVKNQRHREDPVYAAFLDRMRKGECIQRYYNPVGDISNDLDYLRTRELSYIARADPDSLASFNDAPVVVGSKIVRDAINTMLIDYHARRAAQTVHLYHASDSFGRKPLPHHIQDAVWRLPAGQTKDFLGQLPLFPGMRVMVLDNIAFSYGVVNGAEGIVRDIKYNVDSRGFRIASIVHLHIPGCGIQVEGMDRDVVPLLPQTVRIEYQARGTNGVETRSFTRKQIPVIPAYSYTDFKSQGRTLEYVIVDLATARSQGVYVMLSRVKTLKGLAILRWFPPSRVYQRVSNEMRDELHRIALLDSLTEKRFDAGEFDLRGAGVHLETPLDK